MNVTTGASSAQPQADEVAAARARAVALAADTIGELMRFWNFKPSMGRIWTVLYLSQEPLDAEQIEARAGLSAGNVSQTLHELLQWGVVKRVPTPAGSKRRLFAAETDILALVGRVLRERELRLVEDSIAQLEEAVRILQNEGRGDDAAGFLQSRFLITRVSNLLDLARTGRRIVQQLSRTGSADLSLLRGALAERVRGALGKVGR